MQVYVFNLYNLAMDLNFSKQPSPLRQLHKVLLPTLHCSISVCENETNKTCKIPCI